MRISRLFLPLPLATGARIELAGESGHYVRDVLRLKQGASVVVFNGEGGEYTAVLTEVSRKSVTAEIGAWNRREAESPLCIELGLAVSRGERMDFAVQKAVELGVHTITPLLSERCAVQIKSERKEQKREHWRKIARSAAEQCGRNRVPEIAAPEHLMDWLVARKGLKIFLDPHGENSLDRLKPDDEHITLLSGPEGGFSEQERASVVEAGFVSVRLGPRILRAETASMTILTAVQMLWGDFGAID